MANEGQWCAIAAYDAAIALNPNNPYLYVEQGNVYLLQASLLGESDTQGKNSAFSAAQNKFSMALALKEDYASALYYVGLTYDRQGRTSEAITAFSKLARSNPEDQNIKKILDNLRAGRPALDGLVPQPPVSADPVSNIPTPPSTTR